MNTQLLQNLFGVYLVLAIGYNLVSLVLFAKTGRHAAPTEPMAGIQLISILYVVYAIGDQGSNWLYLFFLSSFAALILNFGIIGHLHNYKEAQYFSRLSWLSAIMINCFGFAVLLLIIVIAIL